jgi:CRP-like cAMP-binding protein
MPPFNWLPPDVAQEARQRSLALGESLFHSGDAAQGLYLIEHGEVRLSRVDAHGREITLFRAHDGDFLAEASLFSETYHCDATAAAPTTVRLLPKAALLEAFDRNPPAAQAFMAMLARQVVSLRTRLEIRNRKTARERVLHHLALHAESPGRRFVVAGNLKAMAAEIGLSHESLYRTLAALEAQGVIARTGREIRMITNIV